MQAAGRKLRLFSERAPIAVLELDPSATILDMNPAAENLFGYAAPELVGPQRGSRCCSARTSASSRADSGGTSSSPPASPARSMAEQCLRRDGLELACEWTLTPLVNDEGRVDSIMLQGRDITQQRAAERMQKRVHLHAQPRAAHAAHLDPRLAAAPQAGALGDIDKDQGELAEVAERNGQRLLDLINDMLDIEKIESGKLTLLPEPMRAR